MPERALTFGAAAEQYERFRLGYPDELVDLVLAHADRPVRDALEFGAGTGKATRAFATRGFALTATDPDASMLDELCRHVPSNVTVRRAGFEELPAVEHDLVYCAAALHWTSPDRRWERLASLLRAGGIFATFGGSLGLTDPALEAAVRTARAPYLPEDDVPRPDGTSEAGAPWPYQELEQSPHFDGLRTHRPERRVVLSSTDYVGHLATVSAYLMLDEPTRRATFDAITQVLPERVEIAGDIDLVLARRVHPPASS